MNNRTLLQIYLSGDMPFRPRWLAEWFVMRTVSRWPAHRVAGFIAEAACMYDGASAIAQGLAIRLDGYARNPDVWLIARIRECERQRVINECRRRANGTIVEERVGPGAAWGKAA